MKKPVSDAADSWEKSTLSSSLKRYPERKDEFETSSQIEVSRVYVPKDDAESYIDDLGFPGDYPYTRGVQATMYRGRLWTMRQYAGYASAEESNARYRYLLEKQRINVSR